MTRPRMLIAAVEGHEAGRGHPRLRVERLTRALIADRLTHGASESVDRIASQVEQLRQAMAAFSPPLGSDLDLPADVQEALAPVLAASWERPPGTS